MGDGAYRGASTFFVTLSFLLQMASFLSPGWLIDVTKNVEDHNSIFYKLSCTTLVKRKCNVKTFYTLYEDRRNYLDSMDAGRLAYIQHDKELYDDVAEMAFLMLAFLLTMIIVFTSMVRSCNRDKRYQRLITVSPIILMFAAGLMVPVICQRVIFTYHKMEVKGLDDNMDHTYIGFPYSLAMYIGALVTNMAAVILQASQTLGSQKKPAMKKKKISDDYDAPVMKERPKAQLAEESVTKATVIDNSYDNPSFSVKL